MRLSRTFQSYGPDWPKLLFSKYSSDRSPFCGDCTDCVFDWDSHQFLLTDSWKILRWRYLGVGFQLVDFWTFIVGYWGNSSLSYRNHLLRFIVELYFRISKLRKTYTLKLVFVESKLYWAVANSRRAGGSSQAMSQQEDGKRRNRSEPNFQGIC